MTLAPSQSQRVTASYLVGERLIRMLVGFFVHTWMARHYSAEDFGFISFTVKSASVYFAFGLFGIDEVVIQRLVNASLEEKKDILKTTLLLRLAMGLLGWATLMVITGFSAGFGSNAWLALAIFGVTIPYQALTVYELPFVANMTVRPVFFARNTSYLTGAVLKFVAMLKGLERSLFVAIYGVEEVLWKLLIWWKARRANFTGGTWQTPIARALWASGVLAFLANFVVLFDQRLAFLFVETAQDGVLLGPYSVVVSLLDMVLLLPVSLALALFPKVAKAFESNDLIGYRRERQRFANWLVWSGVAFSVILYLSAPQILKVLYQGKYDTALEFLRYMGPISIWTFFNLARFKWFALEDGLKDWLGLTILSVALQAILLKFWALSYGLTGVAASIAIAQIGANLLLCFRPRVRQSLAVFIRAFVPVSSP